MCYNVGMKKALARRGRPPSLEKQLEEARALARQLKDAVNAGLGVLAVHYPDLMRQAVQMAQGGHKVVKFDRDWERHEVEAEPNIVILKTLLELLPKVTGESVVDESSPIANILRNLRANVANIQVNVESVGTDGQRHDEVPTGVVVP